MTAHDHSKIIWNSQITEIQGSIVYFLKIKIYIYMVKYEYFDISTDRDMPSPCKCRF